MTIWITSELEAIDVVLEPRRPGVATLLASSIDELLPYAGLALEEPFIACGGMFPIGIHIPIWSLQTHTSNEFTKEEFAERLDFDVSPEPRMFKWMAFRPTELIGEECDDDDSDPSSDSWLQQGFGYVWPEDPDRIADALAVDGWENVALIPCYHEILGLESAGLIGGEVESFVPPEDPEDEDPPSLRDLLGGDA